MPFGHYAVGSDVARESSRRADQKCCFIFDVWAFCLFNLLLARNLGAASLDSWGAPEVL